MRVRDLRCSQVLPEGHCNTETKRPSHARCWRVGGTTLDRRWLVPSEQTDRSRCFVIDIESSLLKPDLSTEGSQRPVPELGCCPSPGPLPDRGPGIAEGSRAHRWDWWPVSNTGLRRDVCKVCGTQNLITSRTLIDCLHLFHLFFTNRSIFLHVCIIRQKTRCVR